jgi:hypothetical protein
VIHVITGPPGAGKTTYVHDEKGRADLVIDFDALAYAVGSSVDHHAVPHLPVHIETAKLLWITLVKQTQRWRFPHDVWLIHAKPEPWQIAKYQRQGCEFIALPGKETE